MIEAPWCRVTGRVIGPDAAPHGVGGQVIFDPDPERVFAEVVEGEAPAIVATRVVCVLDEDGYITSSAGRFVDLVAPGPGVLPGGEWTYRMTVLSGSGQWASRMFEHVTLTQGAVVDLADLVPAATYQGDAVTIAEGAAQESAASAEAARVASEASASSAQAAALSAEEAEASASQAAADLATVRGEVASGIHDGTGVVSIVDEDGDGTATVTLTDGSTSDLILPRGPQGVGVASVTNPDGDATALVTLTDGTTQDLPLPTVAQPVFTMATPTTLAAGASATASLSGSYPNLTIGLGLPTGATGQPSATQLIGAGRPDITSAMTADVAAAVAAAPVGSTFNSTDGAGTGAWAWQRTATGWVVTVGDTGWREVRDILLNPATYDLPLSSVKVRKIGSMPFMAMIEGHLQKIATGNEWTLATIGQGFDPAAGEGFNIPITWRDLRSSAWANSAFYTTKMRFQSLTNLSTVGNGGIGYNIPLAIYRTTTSVVWPTTLPGTAA